MRADTNTGKTETKPRARSGTVAVCAWFLFLLAAAVMCLKLGGYHIEILGVVLFVASLVFGCWWLYRLRGFVWSIAKESLLASKRHPLTVAEWTFMLLLSMAYAFLIALFTVALAVVYEKYVPFGEWQVALPVTTVILFIFLLSIWAFAAKLSLKRGWDRTGRKRWTATLVLSALFAGAVAHLAADAPASAGGYSIDDLTNPAKDAEASYRTLMTYTQGGERTVSLVRYPRPIREP